MSELKIVGIEKNEKVAEEMRLLVDPSTLYADPDYKITFMDIKIKNQVIIYVPERFKHLRKNWFTLGEIWESKLSNIYEGFMGEDVFVYDLDCEEKHWNLHYDEEFKELN